MGKLPWNPFTSHNSIHWQVVVGLAAIIALYLVLCFSTNYGIIDDAYISLRYAKNLAEGKGLVFNPGERVEGYTNFLWTLLLAAGISLNLDGVSLSIGLGVLGGCLLLGIVFFTAYHCLAPRNSVYRSIPAPLCVIIQLPFLCYSLSGLETTFFSFLLMMSIYFFLKGFESAGWFNYASLTLAAASLTRPEVYVLFSFNLIFLVLYKVTNKQGLSLRQLVSYAALYICIVGSFFLWRFSYYGFWLPNTYYAKVGGVNLSVMKGGMAYVWTFSLISSLVGVIPLVFLLRSLRKEIRFIYLIGFTLVYLTAVVFEGGDHLAMYRFCVPIIPIVAILYQEVWAAIIVNVIQRYYPSCHRSLGISMFMIFVFVTGLSSCFLMYRAPSKHGLTEYERSQLEVELTRQWADFGRWLKEHTKGDEKIALITAGAIPFYSGLETIDMAGLTDKHIAHLPAKLGGGYIGHEKFDNRYVLSRQPHFVFANHRVQFERYLSMNVYNRMAYFTAHKQLVRMPALHRYYRYRCVKIEPNRFYSFYELRTHKKG